MKPADNPTNRVVNILPATDTELATIEGGRDYWAWERPEMLAVKQLITANKSTDMASSDLF